MVIAYQDTLIRFCPATLYNSVQVPDGYHAMHDNMLNACFDRLTAGENVWVWQHHDARHLLHHLDENYRFVKAAGGLVTSPEGDCLMILRQGRWDLPKGMVEPGETLAKAALREVEEETGILPSTINRLITKTYHIYDKYGGWHLKQTSWYAMESPKFQPHPQTEEDIAQAVWVPQQDCIDRLAHSFASLRLLAYIISQKENTTH